MGRYLRLILCIAGLWSVRETEAHGRLWKPCARQTLFRLYGTARFKANYDDVSLFCGGTQRQWSVNGGKCGICGDAYDLPQSSKRYEVGGTNTYATGFIAETYHQGQQVDVLVELTAAHLGKFFFRICKQTNENVEVTQDCLDRTQLKVEQNGVYNDYFDVKASGMRTNISMTVQLPGDLTCEHCVFQWWYKTGNSWGTHPSGESCLGCGQQETFVNCADVKILPNDGTQTQAPTERPITDRPSTAQPITNRPVTDQPITNRPTTINPWFTTRTPTTQRPTTRPPTNPGGFAYSCPNGETRTCRASGIFSGNRGYDVWCAQHCGMNSANCQPLYCSCTCKSRCALKSTFQSYSYWLGADFCDRASSHHKGIFCDCI
ncbi:uncharacterized protein LOC134275301 [Saccostrea cucullata]|uniref:uncharacterized protein LOC134275301 n=1 Tax=Saccostrea cuccullata TaxID=36930 RepID=UPI002ECFD768